MKRLLQSVALALTLFLATQPMLAIPHAHNSGVGATTPRRSAARTRAAWSCRHRRRLRCAQSSRQWKSLCWQRPIAATARAAAHRPARRLSSRRRPNRGWPEALYRSRRAPSSPRWTLRYGLPGRLSRRLLLQLPDISSSTSSEFNTLRRSSAYDCPGPNPSLRRALHSNLNP